MRLIEFRVLINGKSSAKYVNPDRVTSLEPYAGKTRICFEKTHSMVVDLNIQEVAGKLTE